MVHIRVILRRNKYLSRGWKERERERNKKMLDREKSNERERKEQRQN